MLRALGRNDPPPTIEIGGQAYHCVEIFKHDSWAATARYRGSGGDVVCKFNRVQPVFGIPISWSGRWLARREARALRRLAGLRGIPPVCDAVTVDGRRLDNAVAHRFIAGRPLKSDERPGDAFFPALNTLLAEVHRRRIAYVDLHKRENVLVGDDGQPHLIDFQVCFALWSDCQARSRLLRWFLTTLQNMDRYHLAKHVGRLRPDQLARLQLTASARPPRWIRVHRVLAAPLRRVRRRLLALMRVRHSSGRAATEVFPEYAVRCAAAGSATETDLTSGYRAGTRDADFAGPCFAGPGCAAPAERC